MKAAVSMLLLLMGFSLCACATPKDHVRNMYYTKDPRTNLCFATYRMGGNSGSFSWVPCTPEVEKQIEFTEAEFAK